MNIGAAWPRRSGEKGLSVKLTVIPVQFDGRFVLLRSAEDPPEFSFSGTGSGGEYHFHGHLTRNWPNEASSSGVVDQRPALVGTVSTLTGYLDADRHLGPVYSVYPFIAVKQPPSR